MKSTVLAFAFALMFMSTQADAQLVNFDLFGQAGSGLQTGNEVGGASGSGFGDAIGLVLDTSTNELTVNVAWGSGNGFGDLTGDATAAHLHGPADINSNGGVLINFSSILDNSATDGGINGVVTLSSVQADILLDGETYINVHTADNAGGELRGNLFAAVPEPSSLAIAGLIGAVGFVRRKRN
ncbi:CHRD domain-containing protein [Mariniblastus fucicola]|uniref:CHRD domain protein n=1 Tax=Mariniblastus fucicola TaxID=980251 RepID=A0A5B9P6Y3_9BACT|nr:CHRD domain-containing protein [Mariniblastus fucicola]QEG20690.1 CHRD domain protein [Mariniblastus fucicola]